MKREKSIRIALFLGIILAVFALYGQFLREKSWDEAARKKDLLTVSCPKLSEAGDAFLLSCGGEAVMIDTGLEADGPDLVDLLEDQGIQSLKALILTHYDKDHIGGAAEILSQIPVERCYLTVGTEDSEEYVALTQALTESGADQVVLNQTTSFSALDGEFTIYPPLKADYKKNTDNNLSLIVKVTYMGQNLLFAGDAQKERVTEFLDSQYDGTAYDFLKIPHHGRDAGTTGLLLKAFTPSYALITSSGEEAENEEVVEKLEEAGVTVSLSREGIVYYQVNENGIYVSQGSLEEESSGTGEEGALSAPVFSRESGFYDDSFTLTMQAPEGTKIYYSRDGSVPTEDSELYREPILIEDPSNQENVYSMGTDFEPYLPSRLYEGQEEIYPGYYLRYRLPETTVDKCAVIRAVAVDEDGNTSQVTTSSYFIGYKEKEGYEDISVISLVSDPDGLFGDERGIMVNGAAYKEKLSSGALEGISDTHILRKYTNSYTGRGRDWERETHMDFFGEEDKELIFSQEIGIRLHGNQSRVGEIQKSFNLYAREEYQGDGTFAAPFFEDGILLDTVTLMNW